MHYNILSGTIYGKKRSRLLFAALFVFFPLSVFVIYIGNVVTVSLQPANINGSFIDGIISETSANNSISPDYTTILQKIILDTQRTKNLRSLSDSEHNALVNLSELTPETNGTPIRSGEIHVK